jgi:hypothetical protein
MRLPTVLPHSNWLLYAPPGPYIGLRGTWCWAHAADGIFGGEFVRSPLGRTKFDQANTDQYPHTVARKSAMRLRPGLQMPGDRAGQQLARPLSDRPASRCKRERLDGWESFKRDTPRRMPWPRASGPFSRTTGAEPAYTASGCACGPVRAVRSCPAGVVRAAARFLPDPQRRVFGRCFRHATA